MMKTCKVVRAVGRSVASAMLAALLLAGALLISGPSGARADGLRASEAVFGTVLEVSVGESGTTMWLATDDGVVALQIEAGTVLSTPAGDLTADDVSEGDRVVASAGRDADGALTGARVLVLPLDAGPMHRHIVGVVVEVGDGRGTVLDRVGNTVTVDWPSGLGAPDVGEMITAVVRADARANRLVANFVERAEETVKRLEDAFAGATGLARKQEVRTLIEENVAHHLVALSETLDGVGVRPGERIAAALDRFGDTYALTARSTGARVPARAEAGIITAFSGGVLSVRTGLPGAGLQFLITEETEVRAVAAWDSRVPDLAKHRRVVVLVDGEAAAGHPEEQPVPASRVAVYPAELPRAVFAAVVGETPRVLSGAITLVELDPRMSGVDGVVIVADEATGMKMAAKITSGTGISLNGQPTEIEYLAAGQHAEVWFGGNGTAAEEISARVETRPEQYVSGVVRNLNSNTRSILIEPVRGEAVEFRVSPDAGITRNGRDAGLAEVRTDDLVLAASRFDPSTGVMARLAVHSLEDAELVGVIAGVNEHARQVTVTHRNGQTTTVQVPVEIEIRGPEDRALRLDELNVGDRVVGGGFRPVEEDGTARNVASHVTVGAPEVESLRGIVVLLDEVHAGAGRLVVERPGAEGPVKLFVPDPASRVAVVKNGQSADGLEGVEVGDIVEFGAYDPQTGALSSLTVVTPGAERVRGVVASVNAAAGTLEVLSPEGYALKMIAGESAGIHLNGRGLDSLSGIEPGDTVTAALYASDASGRRTVLTLDVLSGRGVLEAARTAQRGAETPEGPVTAPAPVETVFSGVIESIEGGKWVIGRREFFVTDETQFFGEDPERGLVAKAALRAGDDGAFMALAVSVAGRPGDNPEHRPVNVKLGAGDGAAGAVVVTGVVRTLEAHMWSIDGVKFAVTDSTTIVGVPEIGREARVTLERQADGTPVAVAIVMGEGKQTAKP